MNAPVIVVGAGGHGRVVADALQCAGREVLGFVDLDPALQGRQVLGLPVLGTDAALGGHDPLRVMLANGLGGISAGAAASQRVRLQTRLQAAGWRFTAVRHPSAVLSASARLGDATQLLAGCVVQAGAAIGHGTIVNTAAVVEHDGEVGDFNHLAPRALLCGGVATGDFVHVGAGAIVLQGLRLGAGTLVAAGAVVVRDVAGGLVAGVPARQREARR